MSQVVKTRLLQIVREYRTDKRKISSLSEPMEGSGDEKSAYDPRSHLVNTELKNDLARVFKKLNPIQLSICRLIAEEGMNPTDIARRLQVDRGTVYYELKLIRKIFEKEGMDEYLK